MDLLPTEHAKEDLCYFGSLINYFYSTVDVCFSLIFVAVQLIYFSS